MGMENGGLSAADVALLNGNNDGFGNGWGGMIWLFAILALMGGGFGGWGNNGFANAIGYENLATSNEVQRGFDNQNLQSQTRDILNAVTSGTAQSVATTNQVFHDTVSVLSDKYSELQRDVAANAVSLANLQGNQNSCCCDVKQLIQSTSANTDAQIAQNRYDAAMNTASINANTTAQVQKVLDTIQQNKIESLQSQVSDLQLQNQLAGVVRYPMNTMYGVPSPCFGGCGCCNA
jgi:hypothetical protein